jgi:3-hydroxyisobutyrate dehydrogenase-like beta-hydroxyacid dehydrogenase
MIRTGLIGLGQMGRAIARRLMAAGYHLILFNRTRSRLVSFLQQGAEAAESSAALSACCEAVITMVSDDEAFSELVQGKDGIATGIGQGSVLIDMSTLTAKAVTAAARALRERGADMLHAPILGGPKNVFVGSATITVGGEKSVFLRMRPLLEAISKPVLHVGPLENGTHMKMALNIMLSHLLMGVASSQLFAERTGLDRRLVHSILARASGPVVEGIGEKILSGAEGATFYLRNLEKDQRYFIETAREYGIELPTIAAAQRLSREALDAGLEQEDYTAIFRFMLGKKT